MGPDLLHALLGSRARLNGAAPPALLDDRRGHPALVGDLRGRVVAVVESDAPAVLGTIAAAWERGAVPLLASVDLSEAPWWRAAQETFVLPESVTAAWRLPDSCALVQATSGSSGVPRFAMRSHESFLWESRAYAAAWGGRGPLVHCVRLEHSLGIGLTLSALLDGRDVHHQRPVRANRLSGFGDRVGVLAGTPSTLRVLNEALTRSDLRADTVFCGAGSLAPHSRAALERRWGNGVVVGFGSTETGGVLAGADGIGTPVLGADLVGAEDAAPFQLKMRFPHDVLGHIGGPGPSRVWEFPDLVRRGPGGQLVHVARLTRTMRSRDRTQALGRLADELAAMARDWRLLEQGGGLAPTLIVEGGALTASEAARLRAAGGPALEGTSLRAVDRFPRNELGKVALAELAAVSAGPGGPGGTERR